MTSYTKTVSAAKLKPGDHLCYRRPELVVMQPGFLRDELVGEILEIERDGDRLFVKLGYGRSLNILVSETRTVEIAGDELMVAHRGTAVKWKGRISID